MPVEFLALRIPPMMWTQPHWSLALLCGCGNSVVHHMYILDTFISGVVRTLQLYHLPDRRQQIPDAQQVGEKIFSLCSTKFAIIHTYIHTSYSL